MTACGNSGDVDTDIGKPGSPEGTWELSEAKANGEVIDIEKERWYEKLEIKDCKGKYTAKYDKEGMDKTCGVTLEKADEGTYDIKMRGMMKLGTAKFGTKKMVYNMGDDSGKAVIKKK